MAASKLSSSHDGGTIIFAELKESGVTMTCLMPGETETRFFERAEMLDTKGGTAGKGRSGPVDVAKTGWTR
jgi:short-subunit dehydrogenase